jgi:hypothetical protein
MKLFVLIVQSSVSYLFEMTIALKNTNFGNGASSRDYKNLLARATKQVTLYPLQPWCHPSTAFVDGQAIGYLFGCLLR